MSLGDSLLSNVNDSIFTNRIGQSKNVSRILDKFQLKRETLSTVFAPAPKDAEEERMRALADEKAFHRS
jgi:hypothetical protein